MQIRLQIALCLDETYFVPSCVMVYSVCINNPDTDIVFHVVTDESVSENDRRDLKETVTAFAGKEVVFYTVDSSRTDNFPLLADGRMARAAYYRLFLTDILPPDLDKVLYLDDDCIVRHSLLPLWETDLGQHAVGAVTDFAEGDIDIYNRLRYPVEKGHFNAGVLLASLDKWRLLHVKEACVDYLLNYPERIRYMDQDVLNVVLHDKRLALPMKYNFQTGFLREVARWDYWKYEKELKEGMKDPVVLHFSEGNKPWISHPLIPHPYRSTFYKYCNQTRWKGYRCNRFSWKQIARRIAYLCLHKLRPQNNAFLALSPID